MYALGLPLLLPVSLLLAPLLLDASSTADAGSAVQQWVSQFSTESSQVLQAINTSVDGILKIAWITLLSIGVLLYLTRLSRKLGKDFIFGGAVMLFLVQFVFPALTKL